MKASRRAAYYQKVAKVVAQGHRDNINELGPVTDTQLERMLQGLREAQAEALKLRGLRAIAQTPKQVAAVNVAAKRADATVDQWRRALGIVPPSASQQALAQRGGHRGSYRGKAVKR